MTKDSYRRYFSESAFLLKTKQLKGKLLEYALLLYQIMSEKDTPLRVRLAIIAVLGYLIYPFDGIPDYLPLGYMDDLALMTALLSSLERYTTDEMRRKVQKRLS